MTHPSNPQRSFRLTGLAQRISVAPFVLILAVFLVRMPSILCDREINTDESQAVANGVRFGQGFVPWSTVDGGTSGPLNYVPLYFVQLVTGPLSYRSTHLLVAAIQACVVCLTWAALRRVTTPLVTMLGIGNMLLFLSVAQLPDFVHLSSELIPITLFAMATYCVVRAITSDTGHDGRWWITACFLAGLPPWAKLQAAPISLFFYCHALVGVSTGSGTATSRRRWILRCAAVTIAFSAASLSIVATTAAAGAWPDFWTSYIVQNLWYAGGGNGGLGFRLFLRFIVETPTRALLLGTTVFGGAWWCYGRPGWRLISAQQRHFTVFAGVYLTAALFSIVKSPHPFGHYEWFAVHPAVLLASMLLESWNRGDSLTANPAASQPFRAVGSGYFTALFLALHLTMLYPALFAARENLRSTRSEFHQALLDQISAVTEPTDTLAIWGWAPCLYVETGVVPAVRCTATLFLIEESPQRDFYRNGYMADLRKSMPRVFVDAVAPGFYRWRGWGAESRAAGFPDLAQFLREHYRLEKEVRLTDDSEPVRIYVRTSSGTR